MLLTICCKVTHAIGVIKAHELDSDGTRAYKDLLNEHAHQVSESVALDKAVRTLKADFTAKDAHALYEQVKRCTDKQTTAMTLDLHKPCAKPMCGTWSRKSISTSSRLKIPPLDLS